MNTVALITPPATSHRSSEECLALGYLKSSIKARTQGIEVECVDAWLDGLTVEALLERILRLENLLCVGISAYMTSLDCVEQICSVIRTERPGVTIVAGGFGPTFNQKEFLGAGVDFIVVGEGEEILSDMLIRLMDGSSVHDLVGISYVREGAVVNTGRLPPVRELDSIPFPDRAHTVAARGMKNPPHVATSRGCMASCTFCSIASFAKAMDDYAVTKWRQRSIQNIVDEIELVVADTGVTTFKIVDDSFIEPPRDAGWIRRFGRELRMRGLSIKFRTQVRADRLSEPIVEALAEAGWFATAVGIENGSETALRRMAKRADVSDNIACIRLLEKYGVHVVLNLILFDPYTSLRELEENYAFLGSVGWGFTKGIFSEMYAAQGTAFTKQLGKKDLLSNQRHMNLGYPLQDESVRGVYEGLRAWTSAYHGIHGRVINPLSAPKVIPTEGYADYYGLARTLFAHDLDVFRMLLDDPSNAVEASRRVIVEKASL
jgi:anaerobic magnesium-protoporphyrin IX monomethyl ester cyclase